MYNSLMSNRGLLNYEQLVSLVTDTSSERHRRLVELHPQILETYLTALLAINKEEGEKLSPDGRPVKLVIGHIAGWELFQLIAMGEIMAGVRNPSIMSLSGFKDSDGISHSFDDVDHFNAFMEERQRDIPFQGIVNQARYSATAIHHLLTSDKLLPPELLDQTEPYTWRSLAKKAGLSEAPVLPCAYYLWLVSLEHYTEHADVLFGAS